MERRNQASHLQGQQNNGATWEQSGASRSPAPPGNKLSLFSHMHNAGVVGLSDVVAEYVVIAWARDMALEPFLPKYANARLPLPLSLIPVITSVAGAARADRHHRGHSAGKSLELPVLYILQDLAHSLFQSPGQFWQIGSIWEIWAVWPPSEARMDSGHYHRTPCQHPQFLWRVLPRLAPLPA